MVPVVNLYIMEGTFTIAKEAEIPAGITRVTHPHVPELHVVPKTG